MNVILTRFLVSFAMVVVSAVMFGIHPVLGFVFVCACIALWVMSQTQSM